jgi:hypothetical protein
VVTKEQSEAVSEALLSPAREAQGAVKKREEEHQHSLAVHRRSGGIGLIGLLLGGVAGYVFHFPPITTALVGLGIGFLVGRVTYQRAA